MSQEPYQLLLSLEIFLTSREAKRATRDTLHWYRSRLTRFVHFLAQRGILSPQEITPNHVRQFIAEMQRRNLSDWYVHGHARAVKTFLRFLYQDGVITHDPASRVEMPKLDHRILPALSPEDVRKLLAACSTERDTAIVLCLLDTGLRASEFVSLNVGDVDVKTGAILVRRGKGRKERVVFLGAKSRRALLKYLSRRKESTPDSPLWPSSTSGERLTPHGLRLLLGRLGRRAGVKPCSPHTFRRTFALWSLRSGMNVYALQQLMGHSDLSILRKYLALVQEDLAEAHRRYGAVDHML